ncbi:MAG: ABC transporter substrate-binding protein [Candidatus Rokubacteria bacterium]|nr:ABC transporter substrate-binding protein [Candidatus Rokubacteria bacterium]
MPSRGLTFLVLAFWLLAAFATPPATAADKDTLVIAIDTLGAQVMDPIADTRAPHAHYHAPVWDSLVGFDLERGGIGPGVAERWERPADGKSWTFYLRRGQRFHNGDPVTAHDVKFSLERTMSPESIASGAAALRRAIERIEVVDDLTVRVHTRGVIPHFAASLSRAVFMEGSVMPKKYFEKVGEKGFREKPVGSGPWKFVRNVPGDRIEYEAVDYPHWRGTPQFKRLMLLLVPEQSTRLAMVRTGEASIASLGPEAIKEARAGGMKIVSVPGTMQAVYQFWGLYRPEAKASPLTDVRVREALSLAIDRQQIIDHVMAKQAQWPLPFATFRYSSDMDVARWDDWAKTALRHDPARARKLLADAGHPNGFPLTFWNTALPGTPFMVQIGEAVAGFWEKIGVKVDMKTIEWGAFDPMGRGEQKGLVGTASMYRTAGRPEPAPRYITTFISTGVQHLFGDSQHCPAICQEADRAYEAVVSEKDDARRTAATNRMIETVARSWIAVPIIEGMGYWAVNPKRVGFFKPIPGRHEFGDVAERMPRPEQKPWPN